MIGRAIALFAVTNVDDLVLLALYFVGSARHRRIVAGQYLGFGVLLAVSVAGALGVSLLPERVRPLLGLVPIALGLRAGWQVWQARRAATASGDARASAAEAPGRPGSVGVLAVAGVMVANGGDNLGVYIPVFSDADAAGLVTYALVFLVLVGVWCAIGRFLATREVVARTLARWGHVILPVVLTAVGVLVLCGA